MVEDRRLFSGWACISRAQDVPGCWVAHCFELDFVGIGDSPSHAVDMVRAGVGICIVDDLNRGQDPHARRAPEEAWGPLMRLFERRTRVPVATIDQSSFSEFVVPVTVILRRVGHLEVDAHAAAGSHDAALVDDAA